MGASVTWALSRFQFQQFSHARWRALAPPAKFTRNEVRAPLTSQRSKPFQPPVSDETRSTAPTNWLALSPLSLIGQTLDTSVAILTSHRSSATLEIPDRLALQESFSSILAHREIYWSLIRAP